VNNNLHHRKRAVIKMPERRNTKTNPPNMKSGSKKKIINIEK
jgi:hypothetical protein